MTGVYREEKEKRRIPGTPYLIIDFVINKEGGSRVTFIYKLSESPIVDRL